MSTEIMQQLVERVAAVRREKAALDEHVKAARAEFDAANADLLTQQKQAAADCAAAEAELRAIAEATYKTTGEKAPAPGIVVKVGTSLVYDPAAALAWARETKLALLPESLDVKAFEKIASATDLDFVQRVPKPTVTLASDLDKALASASLTQPAAPAEV